jgi:hypothetical protein
VALVTVVVTGVLGVARATHLIDDVQSFEHFRGEQATTFTPAQSGEYTVYHEYRTARAGDPYSGNDAPPEAFTIRVTSGDGSEVPVRRSNASAYGWGDRKSNALVSFDATAGEAYSISAGGAYGQLAVGPTVPGAPLYGFGPTLLIAGVVLLACLVGALVIRSKRRRSAIPPPPRLDLAGSAPPTRVAPSGTRSARSARPPGPTWA